MLRKETIVKKLATILHSYLCDRGAAKDIPYTTSSLEIEEMLESGIWTIAGVRTDGRQIEYDVQEPYPGYLQKWLKDKGARLKRSFPRR